MLVLQTKSLSSSEWSEKGIKTPKFDIEAMCAKTHEAPEWIHFGAGNIFRGFIAELQQRLLEAGLAETGIIAADTFDYEIIDRIYKPYDNMTLLVLMNHDGRLDKKLVASVSEALHADASDAAYWNRLKEIFRAPSLKMASFTITEKGYSLRGMDGNLSALALADMKNGPEKPVHAMSVVTALALERYKNGAVPFAFVSMDNCSHNGEKLQAAVFEIADAWLKNGFVDAGFIAWLHDEKKVSFPWSMIDKITPRPAQAVQQQLEADGIQDMAPITTGRNTFIAPFVNAEVPQYLVIEDSFPNGRPAFDKLEGSGVYLTDRNTVNRTEQMKVTTCLNPLHTALAVYGCLLGASSIAEEMQNPLLVKLVRTIGYDEGLPVVVNPGILNPKAFIDEVVEKRLPNPFIPDTPQRIATDTSQKVPVRYGETIKSYIREGRSFDAMKGIPLAIAGWFRYLLAIDDEGNEMKLSSDPLLTQLQGSLSAVEFGKPDSVAANLEPLLSNEALFGADLTKTVLGSTITSLFKELIAGPGAVKATLARHLS
ncbi:MAG: mannitol dehydrogenase family protein [Treponema sp.]|nr:mannitol dehydrogenase family protein [Candidatus Treponema caballi]